MNPTDRQPATWPTLTAVTALATGLGAWAWLTDWRWAATGALVFVVLAAFGSTTRSPR